ncbi:hypothetical protein DFJ58DRAFT_917787 [Suillus subalutaceus]|uniref:uncharacterized protein n=1 Tax=Suillus subalutaceus TaxID=48586 RepID=UPI001B865DF0|nr:uncharacterized protein DFJ58DRAFT_917787 [Suillus subalutaceus]KAG1836094.1 hypothetical protein DFJ58DRAFT_917787 [Suillus subalutaceus]
MGISGHDVRSNFNVQICAASFRARVSIADVCITYIADVAEFLPLLMSASKDIFNAHSISSLGFTTTNIIIGAVDVIVAPFHHSMHWVNQLIPGSIVRREPWVLRVDGQYYLTRIEQVMDSMVDAQADALLENRSLRRCIMAYLNAYVANSLSSLCSPLDGG